MADQSIEEGASRLEGVINLFSKEPITQAFLLNCSKTDFAKILQEKGISDIEGLWIARQEYSPVPSQMPQENTRTQGIENTTTGNNVGIIGGLTALPLALNPFQKKDPNKYTEGDLEEAANKQALRAAKEFKQDKVKYMVEMDKARQKYYDEYVASPLTKENAHLIASKSQNGFLTKAIEKDNAATRERLDNEARIYAKKRVAYNKLLRGKESDFNVSRSAIQQYYDNYAKNNRKIAERISRNSTNGALLKALTNDDERIKNSVGFRINQSINQRLGIKPPAAPAAGAVPKSMPGPHPRGVSPLNRLNSLTKKLNPTNINSFITKRLYAVVFTSAFGAIFLLVFGIVFLGGGGVAAGGSGDGGGGSGPAPINPVGGTCVTAMRPELVPNYVHIATAAESNASGLSGGWAGLDISAPDKAIIYSTFGRVMGSTTYFNLLTNSGKNPVRLYFFHKECKDSESCGSSGGGGYGSGRMAFWGFFDLAHKSAAALLLQEHLLIHESGHAIQKWSGTHQGFDVDSQYSKDGSACYDAYSSGNKWLKTYALRDNGVVNPARKNIDCSWSGVSGGKISQYVAEGESEAEAIANNAFCKPGQNCDYNDTQCSTPIVYEKVCSNTYAWVKQHIFGDQDFFTCTPAVSVHNFVALGDSLTAWPNKPVGFTLNSNCASDNSCDGAGTPWPSQLHTADQNFVLKNNAGFPAKKSDYILAQFDSAVKAYNPDLLFVLAGTNDPASMDTIGNLKKIIVAAKAAGIKNTILLTIPHQCRLGVFSNLNDKIKSLSSDAPVIDISGSSLLNCSGDFQADQLHFTDSGAKKVAAYIGSQLKSLGL